MTYIENTFVCIAAPLLIVALCAGKRRRSSFLLLVVGMGICLLSAYINTFFMGYYGADVTGTSINIAPVVEETMKLLPFMFYLLVFQPKQEDAKDGVLLIAAGFATFENICYLLQNGTEDLSHLLIRGFGTGAMHIVCGAILGYGLLYLWKRPGLRIACIVGLLCVVVTYHAIYNLLLSVGGWVQIAGYFMPIVTVGFGLIVQSARKTQQ